VRAARPLFLQAAGSLTAMAAPDALPGIDRQAPMAIVARLAAALPEGAEEATFAVFQARVRVERQQIAKREFWTGPAHEILSRCP
jgi:hypothetical protein